MGMDDRSLWQNKGTEVFVTNANFNGGAMGIALLNYCPCVGKVNTQEGHFFVKHLYCIVDWLPATDKPSALIGFCNTFW